MIRNLSNAELVSHSMFSAAKALSLLFCSPGSTM